MSLRSSGEPPSFTAQRLVSRESWCFTRCIRRDLSSCIFSHLALNHTNLLRFPSIRPCMPPLRRQNCKSSLQRLPALVSIMLEFLPQHILTSPTSWYYFCLPPLQGFLFSRQDPPLLSLYGSSRCIYAHKTVNNSIPMVELTIILNKQHSDTEKNKHFFKWRHRVLGSFS